VFRRNFTNALLATLPAGSTVNLTSVTSMPDLVWRGHVWRPANLIIKYTAIVPQTTADQLTATLSSYSFLDALTTYLLALHAGINLYQGERVCVVISGAPPKASAVPSTAAIIGGVVGGVVGLALLALSCWLYKRHGRIDMEAATRSNDAGPVHPEVADEAPAAVPQHAHDVSATAVLPPPPVSVPLALPVPPVPPSPPVPLVPVPSAPILPAARGGPTVEEYPPQDAGKSAMEEIMADAQRARGQWQDWYRR
jgi:hypothetical protein